MGQYLAGYTVKQPPRFRWPKIPFTNDLRAELRLKKMFFFERKK